MNIGIDISTLNKKSKFQGVYTYSQGLITSLRKKKKNYLFQIYVDEKFYNESKKIFSYKNVKVISLKNKFVKIKMLTKLIILLFGFVRIKLTFLHYFMTNFTNSQNKKTIENNSDIILFLNAHENIYNLRIKSIINFHDVIHKSFSEFLSKKEIILREVIYENCAKYSSKIIASSNYMKGEFLKSFGFLKKNKIKIISEGVDTKLFKKKGIDSKFKKKFNLPKKFLFYPAKLWKNKNHLGLLKAINNIKKKHKIEINLILSGGKKNYSEIILKYIRDKKISHVKYLGILKQSEIIKIYNSCTAVIIPSYYESSSLVLLEACSVKRNIIASNIKPLKEMGKKFHVNYFDVNNMKSFEKILMDFWKGKLMNKNEIEKNYNIVKKNNWSYIAKEYLTLIDKII